MRQVSDHLHSADQSQDFFRLIERLNDLYRKADQRGIRLCEKVQ